MIVGSWVDGLIVVGQRPGRVGRIKAMPALAGKRAIVYLTYAIDPGHALQKMSDAVAARGAEVLGGQLIRRDKLVARRGRLRGPRPGRHRVRLSSAAVDRRMEHRRLGRSGLKVSVLSFGSWVSFGPQLDVGRARDCIEAAHDAGVNFFDNAEAYAGGESERIMGKAIPSWAGRARPTWSPPRCTGASPRA